MTRSQQARAIRALARRIGARAELTARNHWRLVLPSGCA